MVKKLAVLILPVAIVALSAYSQIVLMGRRQGARSSFVSSCGTVNDSNLKGYWPLGEASGNAVDLKGANTLTDNNGVGAIAGKLNGARSFTVSGSTYFSIADNANLSTGDIDFTAGAWVIFTGTIMAGQYWGITGKFETGQEEWILYINGDNQRYQLAITEFGTEVRADNFGVPSTGQWHFIVVWHDSVANTMNIQVNGGTVDSAAHVAGIGDRTGIFTIGAIGVANFWEGRIDEVFFTKRVLTEDERQALYNSGNACRPGGL